MIRNKEKKAYWIERAAHLAATGTVCASLSLWMLLEPSYPSYRPAREHGGVRCGATWIVAWSDPTPVQQPS